MILCLLGATLAMAAGDAAPKPALEVARGQAALDEGDARAALDHARTALRADDQDWRAVRLWLHAGDALGLAPMIEAQVWGMARQDGTVRVAHAWTRVVDGHLPRSVLLDPEVRQGNPRLAVVALSDLSVADGRPSIAVDVLQDDVSVEAADVRIRGLLALGRHAEVAALADEVGARHPEHPEVLAPVLAAEPSGPLKRTRRVLERNLERRGEQVTDPLLLWRLREAWIDAGRPDQVARTTARLVSLGEPPRLPRAPLAPEEAPGLGLVALTFDPSGLGALSDAEVRLLGERLVQAVGQRAGGLEPDRAVGLLEAIRGRVDTAPLATAHAELLASQGQTESALTVARRAVELAALPAHDDVGRLDRGRQALELSEALGIRGRLRLESGELDAAAVDLSLADVLAGVQTWGPLRRRAMEGMEPLVMVQPALVAELPAPPEGVTERQRTIARRLALATDGAPVEWHERLAALAPHHEADALVASVLAMNLVPDAGRAARWAQALQDGGHADAAFVAWSVTRMLGGHASGLVESWRGVGNLDDAADVVSDTWDEAAPRHPGLGRGEIGEEVPEVLVQGDEGPVDLASLQGQVVVLNFWASWCAPCKVELPHLDRMVGELQAQGVPVVLVAVNVDEEAAMWERGRKALALEHARVVHGPELGAAMQVFSLPTTVLVDRDGVLRHRHAGWEATVLPELEASIRALGR